MTWEEYFEKHPVKGIKENVDLSSYSYIKIGGKAQFFIETSDEEILKELLKVAYEMSLPFYIIGHGTNLCFDSGFLRGLFIKIEKKEFFEIKEEKITFFSGMGMMMALQIAQRNGLMGLEFCAGIPGSVGGAIKMNAGTKTGETSDSFHSARLLDKNGIRDVDSADLGLRYRFSNLREDQIVFLATFHLRKGNEEEIVEEKKKVRNYIKERNEKQPLEFPTLGSTFKNPPQYFAAKLIEDCGLKGYREGSIGFSDKHANFLINYGGATSDDLRRVVDFVRNEVFKRTSILLELEIKTIGIAW